MKPLLNTTLLLAIACSLRGAEVPLGSVPATDSRYFWTYDGYREPVRNRNLNGNPISIGGRRFESGICGHTPFSMVYEVGGMANAFVAYAGLEEEDHPKDEIYDELSIDIVVLADRREIYRQEVFWRELPVRLDIDLTGVHQLELRAESRQGKSTHRHRVAFGDPHFTTERPEDLRRKLAEASRERDEALYRTAPPITLPEWDNYSIVFLEHGRFQIDNGACSAVFAPQEGGRLIHFSRPGGENLLAAPLPVDPLRRLKRGWATDSGGGHFLRHLPRNYFLPADPMQESACYTVEFPAEGVVILRSPISRVYLTELEYRFVFSPDQPEVNLTGSVINRAPFPQQLGAWSLTRINREKIRQWEISANRVTRRSGSDQLLQVQMHGERITFTPSPSPSDGFALLETSVTPNPVRFAFDSGETLEIHYDSEGSAHLQFYLTRTLLESEGLGNATMLAPGEKASLKECWRLTRQ